MCYIKILLHLLQLYWVRKWKLISSEVGVKLKNRENSKFSKKSIIVVQIHWTHVRPVRPSAGAPGPYVPSDDKIAF